ncbi:uncharacterized protein c1s.2 [Genypterus blacodes]|uniref:uncharacterized protein c1s.2 n=1 Tax=Genypterus blacodes TaxID=154954 RepID=UPI003F769AE0
MLRLSVLLVLLFPSDCSKLLGWVESPGYPTGYMPHSSLNWSRCAPKGHVLSLKLIHLNMENSKDCENDALKIFSNGEVISVLCGKTEFEELQSSVNPLLLSNPGGCLSLSFHSDYSNIKRFTGFRGFYTVRDFDECEEDPETGCTQFCHNFIGGYYCSCRHGYHLDSDNHTCTVSCSEDFSGLREGSISSPSWPDPYSDNAICTYTLSVEDHLQLVLHFSADFDVEKSGDQCVDSLTVETLSGRVWTFCGNTAPSLLHTYAHHLKIRFTSDGFGSNKGFSFHYTTKGTACVGGISPNSAMAPLQTEYQPGETVTVTCDLGYVVDTTKTKMVTEYEATCQITGTWSPAHICKIWDCGSISIPIDGTVQLVKSDVESTEYGAEIQFECCSKYYMLEGHDTYICNSKGFWESVDGKTDLPRCTAVCGKPNNELTNAGRILGGENAALNEIPWQLLIKDGMRGGATLINDRWAVTAAHVVEKVGTGPLTVYGGLINAALSSRPSDVDVLEAERVIIHPDYTKGILERTNFDNDIALIRFTSRVNLSPRLLPICLPDANNSFVENELGSISGWGLKENDRMSLMLKYTSVAVYPHRQCEDTSVLFSGRRGVFTRNMFCAGAQGKDSCRGDSGSPFVLPKLGTGNQQSRGPYRLTGIVSWGPPCGQEVRAAGSKVYKGYYTKVENYVNWIQETMANAEREADICSFPTTAQVVHRHVCTCMTDMGWTLGIIWFLYASVCECRRLPPSQPVMHGEVHSPEYPQPYPPNQVVRWDLSVPVGYQIQLTFTHLDIEASGDCYYDALTVLSGQTILGKFCGQKNSADGNHPGNQPMLFLSNKLTLIFQSDDTNPEIHQNIGFSAHYQAIDKDECSKSGDGSGPVCSHICLNTLGSFLCSCHHGYELLSDKHTCVLSCSDGIFDEPEGHLSSPGYPKISPNGMACQYVISVQPGFMVSLNFTENFHIENTVTDRGPSCPYSWLQVTIPNREPEKLCGRESPGLIATNSNTVKLDYHTDREGLSRGWSLDYSTHRVKCPDPSSVAKGTITPVMDEYLYSDYIFVRCNQGYKLMTGAVEIESYSTSCQSSGQWHLPLPECQIIDCGEPKPLKNGGVTFISGSNNQYRSVIQYHCNEPFYSHAGGRNVRLTCEADRQWRSNTDDLISPICIPVCGQPTEQITGFGRIIGGNVAPNGTIPWQVLLAVNGRGGGMVIADRWILTAAHVVKGISHGSDGINMYIGIYDAEALKDPVYADSIHVHPGYNNPNFLNYNNDIALIKLQNPITFSSSVMPICLPAQDATYIAGDMGMVSGFGLRQDENKNLLATNKLNYVRIPVVAPDTCSASFRELMTSSTKRMPSLSANMFCAGLPEGKKDSCQGDSGGPYSLKDNGRIWAAGIVSWGFDCGARGSYGVYTKVANYRNWIDATMLENLRDISATTADQFTLRRTSPRHGLELLYHLVRFDSNMCVFLYVSEYWWLVGGVWSWEGRPESGMTAQIKSRQYPEPYPPNLSEQWELKAAKGHRIQLTFTHLDMMDSSSCFLDSLTVLYENRVLQKFCGQENSSSHPGKDPILYPGNRLTLLFQANRSPSDLHQYAGFSADYKHIIIDCGERPHLMEGSITLISGTGNQYGTVLEYSCDLYHYPHKGRNVTVTCEEDGMWRTSCDVMRSATCVPGCGRTKHYHFGSRHCDNDHYRRVKRIVGGSDAPADSIPWQVLLGPHQKGGGMVITDRWILTAAHQVTNGGNQVSNNSLQMYVGITNIRPMSVSSVYAASIHVHPEYNNIVDYNNDIALIKLQNPITFNSSIKPISLPSENATYNAGMMGLVSGFGLLETRGPPSSNLKYVRVPLVSQETCNNAYGNALTDNMFCAGVPEGGKDACGGDGGSALALETDGQFWAAGIVSWGSGCGKPDSYGVYTKIANYLDWIKKTMKEN